MIERIRKRIEHLNGLRRFIEIKPLPTARQGTPTGIDRVYAETIYLGSIKVETNNLSLLKACYKSGSWVHVKFLGYRKTFWTSRNLRYFPDVVNSQKNRNFGIRLIVKSEIKIYNNVSVDPAIISNSLNIYNRKIIPSEENCQINEAFYLCVNGSDHFQHFVQDFLPILVSMGSHLKGNSNSPIILNKPSANFKNFNYFFEVLNISNPKVFIDKEKISVKKLFLLDFEPKNRIYCLPSEMYQDLFDEIQKRKVFRESKNQNLICFIRNEKTRNFANTDFVTKELSDWAKIKGLNPFFVNPSNIDLTLLIDLLSSAKYVFGAHGGAIYNMLFAARDSTLIEFIATDSTDSLSHMVRSFGQNYLPYAVKMNKGSYDFEVSKNDFDLIFACLE